MNPEGGGPALTLLELELLELELLELELLDPDPLHEPSEVHG
jgi:hypothetical protein